MENLIEDKTNRGKKNEEDGEEKKKRPVIKSATDLQRLKLEKLMKNPEKQIIIPEQPKEKDYMQTVPSFVRNVMGSSAGAGSGEFHVYRHLRRKEYARQKCIQAKSMREQLDDEYQSKLEKNRLDSEAKTAKKRAKRLKKKQRGKKPRTKNGEKEEEKQETTDDDDDADEGDDSTIVEKDVATIESAATEAQVTADGKESEDKTETQQHGQETIQQVGENGGSKSSEAEEVDDNDPKAEQSCQTDHEIKSGNEMIGDVENPKLEELPT